MTSLLEEPRSFNHLKDESHPYLLGVQPLGCSVVRGVESLLN